MRKPLVTAVALLAMLPFLPLLADAQAAATAPAARYASMAALDQYLISDPAAEIALARSAAPPAIADAAEILVLHRTGFSTAVKGTNGFVCVVERSWAKPTDDPEFWNPKMRAPTCFNAAASKTFLPIFLLKTRLVLAGRSSGAVLAATNAAFASGDLPALAPGAMCYMMSRQQYLSDDDQNWHPHVMFFAAGDTAPAWGANLPGSPLIAGNDPEERVTVFMMYASRWSDGTPFAKMP